MELRDVSRLPIVPRTEPGGSVSRTASLLCWLAFHSWGNQMLHSARPNAGAEDTGHGLDRAIGGRHLDHNHGCVSFVPEICLLLLVEGGATGKERARLL